MINSQLPPVFGSIDEMLLAILRDFFAGQAIHVATNYTEGMPTPAVICRRDRRSGTLALTSRDDKWMESAIISLNTITQGVDADEMGEELQEACRYALRRAQQLQISIPNGGSIAVIAASTHPSKVSDWQTATSVVQYASLPKGAARYESVYRILVRPPAQASVTNRYMPNL